MSETSETAVPFVERFTETRARLPGAGRDWAEALREAGIERFGAEGLPTRKAEAWKFTDLRPLAKLRFAEAPALAGPVSEPLRARLDGLEAATHRVVLVNGHVRPDLSRLEALPAGARLRGFAAAMEDGDPLLARHLGRVVDGAGRPMLGLNTALMQDGLVLELAPDTVVEEPIRILWLSDRHHEPYVAHSRSLIVAGARSRAIVVESWHGVDDTAYFNNGAVEVVAEDGARISHFKLQAEGAQAFHLAGLMARIGRDAIYDNFILSFGGALARNDIHCVLCAPGGECRISGGYLGRAGQVLDTTSFIDHAEPDCRSREVYKGVLDGQARGVFQGKILVRRHAQRTDGYQLNRALLLSRGAEIDSKPELEIYADDVKCSHGATAGEIDHEALFYLRARGIPEAEARALLVEAFIRDVLEEIRVDPVRDEFTALVSDWLADSGGE